MVISVNELLVFFVSALPVGELRAGIPVGLNLGLNPWLVFTLAVLGNLAPVLPILLLLEPISSWLMNRFAFFDRVLGRLFEQTRVKHSAKIELYGLWALFAFVAIPSPGTGAWTGSLVAWLFGIELKHAIPAIIAGVLAAGLLVLAVSTGAMKILRFLEDPLTSVALLVGIGVLAFAIIKYRSKNNVR